MHTSTHAHTRTHPCNHAHRPDPQQSEFGRDHHPLGAARAVLLRHGVRHMCVTHFKTYSSVTLQLLTEPIRDLHCVLTATWKIDLPRHRRTCTHAHIHARTHAHIHTRTHILSLSCTHIPPFHSTDLWPIVERLRPGTSHQCRVFRRACVP